jgi:SAM-dependent methyltransferase
MNREDFIKSKIEELGPWFQNIEIEGIQTNPQHLGNPSSLWGEIKDVVTSKKWDGIVDVGCNGGYFEKALYESGYRGGLIATDIQNIYLRQTEFVLRETCPDVKWIVWYQDIERHVVYDGDCCSGATGTLNSNSCDLVLFLGVLYHLENPIKGLRAAMDIARELVIMETEVAEGEGSFMRYRDWEGRYINNIVPSMGAIEKMVKLIVGEIVNARKRPTASTRWIIEIKPPEKVNLDAPYSEYVFGGA